MSLRSLALSIALWLLACSSKSGDPPPPVASGSLPAAPPNATGALAAGRESARPEPPLLSDSEEEIEPGVPMIPAPSDDGGTEL